MTQNSSFIQSIILLQLVIDRFILLNYMFGIFWKWIDSPFESNYYYVINNISCCIIIQFASFYLYLWKLFLFLSPTNTKQKMNCGNLWEWKRRANKRTNRRAARHVPKLSTFMISSEYYIDTIKRMSLKSLFYSWQLSRLRLSSSIMNKFHKTNLKSYLYQM